jgi:hypothetical protein
VLGTGVSASVVVRYVPPFSASALPALSLLTGAPKSYAGSVNIRLYRHSPMRISPRATLDGGKRSPDALSSDSVYSKRYRRFTICCGQPASCLL